MVLTSLLKKEITEKVNDIIKKLPNGVSKIYGGGTGRSLKERIKEHHEKNEPLNCKDIKHIKIVYKTKNFSEISKIEMFLIKYLDKTYPNKSQNSHNNNGSLKQPGGSGIIEKENGTYKFYIMFKKAKKILIKKLKNKIRKSKITL